MDYVSIKKKKITKFKGKKKMQVRPFRFDQNSFESSNFTFAQLSPLSFKFIQLRSFYQISLNIFCSNLEGALYLFAQFKTLSNS